MIPTDTRDSEKETDEPYAARRGRLVAALRRDRGIRDERVLAAMERVPRELFVPAESRHQAYQDCALPIALGQTISQPYIVALMTELSQAGPGSRVLEVGTGCGYQTAVLAALGAEVYTVEILAPLAEQARARLDALGYRVHAKVGDGFAGYPEAAPFDAILVTAAPEQVPKTLVDQLAEGGRMVVPVGPISEDQKLLLVHKAAEGVHVREVAAVRFVPMVAGD